MRYLTSAPPTHLILPTVTAISTTEARTEPPLETAPGSDRSALATPTCPDLLLPTPVRPVRIQGKFLHAGDERFDVRGVTYGPFEPDEEGCEYGDVDTVAHDFREMSAAGFNSVRLYTVPPLWLLDAAQRHGLRVMVGLPWEQHVTFLDDRRIQERIFQSIQEGVRSCAGHPALLCFSLGNEIPASVVRWHGPEAVERFIKCLYSVAKAEDPETLVTYVSYPTTEYLQLPFLDFITFNVYLEDRDASADYIARLQNIAGEQPLVMAEVGLDSIRNGEDKQAETLAWQVETAFQGGCAGAFVFSWTDEWFRGGKEIEDWAFGLVTRDRRHKPALAAVGEALQDPLLPEGRSWPSISVVVCSYNGAATIRQTLEYVEQVEYDNVEVIVVDDGSTDSTASIAREFDVRLISVPNGGLSSARNIGMRAATGEIVAYIDDDAYPDSHWLTYVAIGFLTSDHVGIGGPNVPPPDDGHVADCVANAPGGPSHVLYTDTLAEHLPGCNMAFRRDALLAIDGFDTRFRIAGDDVDLCWRLIERGGTLGFHASAVVWHHRRGRVAQYLRQQRNYGRAEAMLEQKWPDKYNRIGHLRWAGTLYGKGHTRIFSLRERRIEHGVWGTHLFQSVYGGGFDSAWYLTLMPEWYLVTAALSVVTALGLSWPPLFWLWPILVLAVVIPLVQVVCSTARARFTTNTGGSRSQAARLYGLTALLHVVQPLVRLVGRVGYGLTPWRRPGLRGYSLPRARRFTHWSEEWREPTAWLQRLECGLKSHRGLVRRGGVYGRWDLHVDCGLFGGAGLVAVVEEHGSGRQFVRVRAWPRVSKIAVSLTLTTAALATAAGCAGAWVAGTVLGAGSLIGVHLTIREMSSALHMIRRTIAGWSGG